MLTGYSGALNDTLISYKSMSATVPKDKKINNISTISKYEAISKYEGTFYGLRGMAALAGKHFYANRTITLSRN